MTMPRKSRKTSATKKRKISKEQRLLKAYVDPEEPGSLGGVGRFARQHRIFIPKARRLLEKDLAYTLHKPRRKGNFPTLPVLVFGIDEQWVADLVEVQTLSRYNGGNRYLSTHSQKSRRTKTLETPNRRWKGVLQQDVPGVDERPRHSSLFDQRRYQGQRGGTIQSYLERTNVPLFYGCQYAEVCAGLTSSGEGLQQFVSSEYWYGSFESRLSQRKRGVESSVCQTLAE